MFVTEKKKKHQNKCI